jgi:putative transposase
MAEKFKNKYRIPSARLAGYDYGQNGAYFITICTQGRVHFFGKIIRNPADGDQGDANTPSPFVPTDAGRWAETIWHDIPAHFSYIELGEFVVMPNHVHAIIIINKPPEMEDMEMEDMEKTGGITGQHNPMLHDNLSRVVRWYKGRTTHEIRKTNPDFGWQSRFHDHIIRDAGAFDRIGTYIVNNPFNWKDDKFS